jgi:hypothetical protein
MFWKHQKPNSKTPTNIQIQNSQITMRRGHGEFAEATQRLAGHARRHFRRTSDSALPVFRRLRRRLELGDFIGPILL